MKKILIVRGGGRPNGNTAQLAAAFAGGAREAGHAVEEVSLSQVQVQRLPWLQRLPLSKTLRPEGRLGVRSCRKFWRRTCWF